MPRPHRSALLSALLATLYTTVVSQSNSTTSKRGFGISESQGSDLALLLSGNSLIDWYYTWSLYPASSVNGTRPFAPLIHGLDDASQPDLHSILNKLPSSSTHLLTFNEPDGSKDSGGSSISAKDAAKSYMDNIVPLRTADRAWNISHPVTTGSGQGLEWLRQFNESCYELDKKNGCPTDFIAVHWYGDFEGLTSWLATIRKFYSNSTSTAKLKFWITEFALPQGDNDATMAMMNKSLAYLDELDYVETYAWFGAFRADKANGFVGSNVALLDTHGGLTDLGAAYLGGKANGFETGMGSSGAPSVQSSGWAILLTGLTMLFCL